jgi:CheY-like chemotaxis protein
MIHTVLLVEDEEGLREAIREALEEAGYAVVTAREGQEALDAIPRIDHICLVLLDLLMPGMNGWEFLEAVKTRPELACLPVIVHTSAPSHGLAGVVKVLQKPLQIDRLLSVVREYCAG